MYPHPMAVREFGDPMRRMALQNQARQKKAGVGTPMAGQAMAPAGGGGMRMAKRSKRKMQRGGRKGR